VIPPSFDQRMQAARELWDRGWGKPIESIKLEADITARAQIEAAVLPTGTLSSSAAFAMRELLERELAKPALPESNDDAVDAEFSEAPTAMDADPDELA
jgi:hypothetical protein